MPKTSKAIVWIIVIALVVWAVLSATKKTDVAIPDPIIKIGVIAPLSDAFADYGEEVRKGVMAGKGTANVEFVFEDEKCDPKTAVSAFKKLTEFDNVDLIIGPGCGSPQEAIVPLLKDAMALVMVPSAASKGLFEKSGGSFFNIQYSLEDESKFIANSLDAKGYKNVALITYNNAFSATHRESFKKNFKGNIVLDTVLADNDKNILTQLEKIKSSKAEAIYSPDISFFFAGGAAKLAQLGIKIPVYSTYVAELPAARSLVEGVTYSFPADVTGLEGGVYGLSKQAAEILGPIADDCNGDVPCVKNRLMSSGKFDATGVSTRGIIMKRIEKGIPAIVNE